MNNYYTPTGNPQVLSRGSSAVIAEEFTLIEAGFNTLPSPATLYAANSSYAIDTGTLNAYAITLPPEITSYQPGLEVVFKAISTNTGACTINAGFGVVNIVRNDGGQPLAGYIQNNGIVALRFDGTNFQMYPQGVQGIPGTPLPIVNATGSSDIITADYSPAITLLTDLLTVRLATSLPNATAIPSFSPNGLTPYPITTMGGQQLTAGMIAGNGYVAQLSFNYGASRWELMNPAGVAFLNGNAGQIFNVAVAGSAFNAVPLSQAVTLNTSGNAATTSQTNFSNLTIGGSQVLAASNFNSYAPTLGGSGTSGTWPISINGTAVNLSGGSVTATSGSFSGVLTIQNAAASNQPLPLGQAEADFAAIAGLSSQVFNVAPATTPTEAIPLAQGQANFAPLLHGQLISATAYSASSNYNPATNNPSFIIVKLVGGGGGGGSSGNSTDAAGSGGAAGGEGQVLIPAATLGSSLIPITIGAGGLGATSLNTNGGSGVSSTFGSLITAAGGSGGFGSNGAGLTPGSAGGNIVNASGTTFLESRQGYGSEGAVPTGMGTNGGSSSSGAGGLAAINTTPYSRVAGVGGYGAGGGGGCNSPTSSYRSGGNGGQGYCIIYEYK